VLRDQLVFMARCGFDAFEVADERVLEAWLEARDEISLVYQPATDRRRPVMALRREEAREAGRGAAAVAPGDAGKLRVCAAYWAF